MFKLFLWRFEFSYNHRFMYNTDNPTMHFKDAFKDACVLHETFRLYHCGTKITTIELSNANHRPEPVLLSIGSTLPNQPSCSAGELSHLRIDTTFVTGGRYFEYINKTIHFNPNDVYIFGNANKLWK